MYMYLHQLTVVLPMTLAKMDLYPGSFLQRKGLGKKLVWSGLIEGLLTCGQ